jgi:hypothetical protein
MASQETLQVKYLYYLSRQGLLSVIVAFPSGIYHRTKYQALIFGSGIIRVEFIGETKTEQDEACSHVACRDDIESCLFCAW